jgi:hypothetical protein
VKFFLRSYALFGMLGPRVIADRTHEVVGRWTRWHIQGSKTDGRIGVDWDTVKALRLMIPQAFLLRACEVMSNDRAIRPTAYGRCSGRAGFSSKPNPFQRQQFRKTTSGRIPGDQVIDQSDEDQTQ